jgi:hypothetical protein
MMCVTSIRGVVIAMFALGVLSASGSAHSVQLSCDALEPSAVQPLRAAAQRALPREVSNLTVRDVCAHRAAYVWAVVLFSPRPIGPNLEESFRVFCSNEKREWQCPNTEVVRRLKWEHSESPVELLDAAAKDAAGSLGVLRALDKYLARTKQEAFKECGTPRGKQLAFTGDVLADIESIGLDDAWQRAVLRLGGQDSFNKLVVDVVHSVDGYSVGESVCASQMLD